MKRCGYWISERKRQKMRFDDVIKKCREHNLDFIMLDLDKPIEDQGPFDLVLHKFTDKFGLAEEGHEESIRHLKNLESYTIAHPEVPMLDPVPHVRRLLDRHRQYTIVSQSPLFAKEGEKFMIPAFVDFPTANIEDNKKRMVRASVKFPILCKPILAHGPATCHKMTLIFNERGLKDVSPPCVAQTFVPHGAVLFKLYVLGNQFSVVERPSLKNFKACDSDTIFFNSHDVSKPTSASSLSKLDEEDKGHVVKRPTDEEMANVSHAVREVFGLQLVGIDVIVDNETGKYGIIDVNAFPGYEGSPGFPEMFCNMIKKALEDAEKQEEDSKKCFSHSNTAISIQNGASTFQPKQNGSSDQNDDEVSSSNGFESNQTKHKQEPEDVSTEDVPSKKMKLYDPLSECDSSTTEIKTKSGPRSLSPDH